MQTFLPYADYRRSAEALDNLRLGKQRVETLQTIHVLMGLRVGWRNHPAVKMWIGHGQELARYGIVVCAEWRARGYDDTCMDKIGGFLTQMIARGTSSKVPAWLGNEDFHRSHQSNLIRKWPEFYAPQFPGVPDNLPYVWPA